MNGDFEQKVIDRLARIEEKLGANIDALKKIDDRLGKGDSRMDCQDLQIQAVEQTLYGDKSKNMKGLCDKVSEHDDELKDFKVKSAVVGAVLALLGYLGITNLGKLGDLLGLK